MCMCLSGCVGGGVTQAPFTRLCSSGIALKLVPFFSTARELHIEHKNSPSGINRKVDTRGLRISLSPIRCHEIPINVWTSASCSVHWIVQFL